MRQWRVAPSTGSRLPTIEGLRAFAASSIVLYHIWLYADPKGPAPLGPLNRLFQQLPLGVTLFFTISGFLLYGPFAAALLRGEAKPAISSYLRNRALRILPAYWVILLATGLVLQSTLVRFDLRLGSLGSRPDLLVRDALLIQNYSPGSIITGIGPAWSLAIEVVFYLALPLLALLSFACARRASDRRRRRWAALVAPLAVLAIGLSGKLVGTFVVRGYGPGTGWLNDWHSVVERSFWGQADLFTFGMVLAVLKVEIDDGIIRLPAWWRWVAGVGMVALASGTAVMLAIGWLGQYAYDNLEALAAGILLAIVVLPSSRGQPFFTRVLERRPAAMIGVVSYSLFLWHEPVVWWMRSHGLTGSGIPAFGVNVLVIGSISLGLAALTYRFVELPALRLKRRPISMPSPPQLVVVSEPVGGDDLSIITPPIELAERQPRRS